MGRSPSSIARATNAMLAIRLSYDLVYTCGHTEVRTRYFWNGNLHINWIYPSLQMAECRGHGASQASKSEHVRWQVNLNCN